MKSVSPNKGISFKDVLRKSDIMVQRVSRFSFAYPGKTLSLPEKPLSLQWADHPPYPVPVSHWISVNPLYPHQFLQLTSPPFLFSSLCSFPQIFLESLFLVRRVVLGYSQGFLLTLCLGVTPHWAQECGGRD